MSYNASQRSGYVVFFALFLIFLPTCARADAGLPLILITFPAMLLMLVPICLLEAAIYRFVLQRNYREMLFPSFIANIVSTIFGIPLAWLLQFWLQNTLHAFYYTQPTTLLGKLSFMVFGSAWLFDGEPGWLVPTACIVSLVPAFFLTLLIEYWPIRLFLRNTEKRKIIHGLWQANLISYGVLALFIPLAVLLQQFINR